MKRKPDRLDLIAQLVVAAIVFLAMLVARRFGGAEHPLLLCVGLGILFLVLAMFAHFLTRQG